jgi:hypothetical protein
VEAEAVDSPPLILITDFIETSRSTSHHGLCGRGRSRTFTRGLLDRRGLTEGRRRIHGYSNNELAFYPEGSRRAHAFIK